MLLPQPDAPSRHTNSPGATSSVDAIEGGHGTGAVTEDLRNAGRSTRPRRRSSRAASTSDTSVTAAPSGWPRACSTLLRIVRSKMLPRSLDFKKPSALAWSADVWSDEAIGSSVNVMCPNDAVIRLGFSALPVAVSMPWPVSCCACVGFALMRSTASTRPLMRCCTTSGCAPRNLVVTMSTVVANLPCGHNVASSTRTLPPPSFTRRVAHGSGTHAPSMLPCSNAVSVIELSCGHDRDVAAARRSGASRCRSATCAARRLACCRAAAWRPSCPSGRPPLLIDGFTTKNAPPDAVPATMRTAAVRLLVRVDRGVRADERRVERAREERGDGFGPGVERLRRQLHVRAELRRERSVLRRR